MPARKVGTIGCLACGNLIPVKQAEGGSLSVCCSWCDLSAYAKKGTEAFRLIEAKMTPETPPAAPAKPAPEPEKKEAPPAPPPQKAAKSKGALPWMS